MDVVRKSALCSDIMILFSFILVIAQCALAQNIQVNTTEGVVEGRNATDGNYYNFYGLFYGGNTAGENRFKAPTPPPLYPGVYSAHESTIICAQPSSRGIIGVENCLTLNIFTNGISPAKPVMVWLEGEEYNKLDTSRSFRNLVTEGIVVVQMNYRLSVFGFLCLGVAEAPGNAGLKDVVQGLKWIKQNIAGFGGDPNNVILFGHGSGAAMVDLMTLSPLVKDLFHKAIVQSGSALAPWAVSYNPIEYAQAFGAKFGYSGKSNTDLATHLVTTDLSLIANALNEFEFHNNSILFAPCIENPNLNPNDTFLADAPLKILRSGDYNHVPYIAGYTDKEGTMRVEQGAVRQPSWLEAMESNFTDFLPVDLNFGNNLTNVQKTIREFYFAQSPIDMATIDDFLDYQGDTLILVSVIKGVRERAATSKAEVRLMEFACKGTQNTDWVYNTVQLTGARHGIVLNYLLDNDLRAADRIVMTSLIRRYLAFMTTGSPNPGNDLTHWFPVSNDSINYVLYAEGNENNIIIFTEESRVSPHTQRMTFWNDIYFKYYVLPQQVSSSVRILGVTLVLLISQIVLGVL